MDAQSDVLDVVQAMFVQSDVLTEYTLLVIVQRCYRDRHESIICTDTGMQQRICD